MLHADKTVTVYRKEWDKERGVDSYRGTVLKDVSFFSRIATNVSTDGLNAACEGTLRIPMESIPEGLEIRNGDLVCEGSVTENPETVAQLDNLCPYVFTVVGITRNTSGRAPHVKVVCK